MPEPISELPPDEIPTIKPEIPKSPESPGGGLVVEVRQPELIYSIAQDIVDDKKNGLFTDISATNIGDELFRSESTTMSGFSKTRGSGQDIDGTFHIQGDIRLAGERVLRADHGYFSDEKVQSIEQSLKEANISTSLVNRWGGLRFIIIEKDGNFFEANLDFPNREAEENVIREKVKHDRERNPNEPGYDELYRLPRIKEGLVNDRISLSLINKSRAESGFEGYPKLEDEESFRRTIDSFAKTYEALIKAVYKEEGVQPKDARIILRPPVSDADAFTQIKSVETPVPVAVTKEQVSMESVGFDEIAGQDEAVAEAKKLVLAINNPEVFEKRGVKRPKGILLYGPPGTGKTLIAKAIASESNALFSQVSAADIGTKWYGESERLMQEVFDRANRAVERGRKVLLFFDEVDSLAPSREHSHEATKKVVATMLQNIDGMKANPNVTILYATNRPQDIDPALKRPGRTDKIIEVGLPNADGRRKILQVHMEKARKNASGPELLFDSDIDLSSLDEATDGMSGADLANVVNLILEAKVMSELEGQPWSSVNTSDLLQMAKRLGIVKEEKKRIGFVLPEKNGGNR